MGDPQDPLSAGHVCPKAVALKDVHEDPDRLRRPLRRRGSSWEEVSWEEALQDAAERIAAVQKVHGRNAVAAYVGKPNVHNYGATLFSLLFLKSLGSRSRYSATSVDQLPQMLASLLMFGHQLMRPIPDVDRTDFLLMLGANPLVSNGSLLTAPGIEKRLKALRARGGRLVVVDPRRTETAGLADLHLVANHLHAFFGHDNPGYCNRAVLAQDLSAVTAACMMTWHALYVELGGLTKYISR